MPAVNTEARIVKTHNILLAFSVLKDEELARDFCGTVLDATDPSSRRPSFSNTTVYLCGDLAGVGAFEHELKAARRVFVIEELSTHHDGIHWPVVDKARVPLLVHGVGVLHRRFFDSDCDYFNRIRAEHGFQSLTESNKPAKAHRTGIYLTPVERHGRALHFRLLRCSSNLSGPTGNFRATDRHIVDALNLEARDLFEDPADLNHVLAQLYWNTPTTPTRKQTKAKIKGHADKTKDMPANGIMAFCTFYDQLDGLKPLAADPLDYGYKTTSGLTTLHFRLKPPVAQRPGCTLPQQFHVTLYPNSVFFMPLSTNRLYTHELRPSVLDAAKLPTRLGYVVRCSNRMAIHEDGQTFLERDGERVELEPPTAEGMAELRRLYAEENRTDAFIDYGDRFPFSMNAGDYTRPEHETEGGFQRYDVPTEGNPFEALLASVRFEGVTKGRQGAVLVDVDPMRGVPIVRTTTQYDTPAQCFGPLHVRLARQIQELASLPFALNNALIELYDNTYASMGMHSDQALDLEGGSSIAVFSCYRHPEQATPPRMLVIASKEPGGGTFEVPLTHNSVVVFSLDTNRRFTHKIVLDTNARPPDNQWLGLTFRTSRTFVQSREERMVLDGDVLLTLAEEDQRRAFYKLRGRENREMDFIYPPLTYTISPSDLMRPVPAGA